MTEVQSSSLVTLPQMVDLSLNYQQGIINFQVLRTLLQVIIQQLSLTDVAVELRGSDSERIHALVGSINRSPSASVTEHTITATPHKKKKITTKKVSLQDVKEKMKDEEKKEKELRVIERRKDSKEDPDINPLPLKSPPGSQLGVSPTQTIVFIESQTNLPQFSVAVSKTTFEILQEELNGLKEKVKELTELPANMGLIEATRTHSGPILDMFQILTLNKRVDGIEEGMSKVGSLLEELVKISPDSEITEKIRDQQHIPITTEKDSYLDNVEKRLERLEDLVDEIVNNEKETKISEADDSYVQEEDNTINESVENTKPNNKPEKPEVKEVHKKPVQKEFKPKLCLNPEEMYDSVLQNVDLSDIPTKEAFKLLQQEFENLKKWVQDNLTEIPTTKDRKHSTDATSEKVSEAEADGSKQISEMDSFYQDQMKILGDKYNNLQNEMNAVFTKLETIQIDSTGINEETTLDLANKLQLLEKEIIAISEKATALEDEKEERDRNMEAILEQIDILKIVKANREDLEDALGDKADACMINRKVSHDQFDAACDDLSRGIEEALAKLEEQQEMWRQALDAIYKDVGNKLDKNEVDPLRDFVNSKLKALQEKFKSLTALRKEQEAAGTKSKYLRNVNCISCDKDVIMRKEMDPSLKPKPYAMPPSRNIAPYLAYELDQLRKQQKCVPSNKNLNFLETALKTRASKDKDHVCNRYCGGSHTVTTPQQRVTRLGHFLEQWGPEIAPINEEYIRGSDKHMYKARDETGAKKQIKTESMQIKASIKVDKEADTREINVSQKERNTFVNSLAQEALTNQIEKRDSTDKEKIQNIGKLSENNPQEPQIRQIQEIKSQSSSAGAE